MNHEPDIDFQASELADMSPNDAAASIIQQATRIGASDLYFLCEEKNVAVAVRRLGTIEQLAAVSMERGRHLINLIKANAGMDIAEQRRPMDGRLIFDEGGVQLDLRINCIPTLYGQDLTCRLLDRHHNLLPLDQLGLNKNELGNLTAMLKSPSGLILVTGPTGTGKTTTLYACMEHLNDGKRKINTLEDPIEYAMKGIRQSQVNAKLGVNFSDLLRNVLRQAPDVIMIGEIRDEETATTAVRAANSGHLVLATSHAPVAASAVQSMLALGAHPYFLASCLLGVVAQRLIRTLCEKCRIEFDISEAPQTFEEIQPLLEPGQGKAIYMAGGCEECFEVGYVARTGLFEVMPMNRDIRQLVAQARPSKEIEVAAMEHGMVEFRRSALLKVAQGVTSTEEMLRAVPSEYLGLED